MPASDSMLLQRRLRFAGCYATFIFNGILALTIGALLPYIRDSYTLSYSFSGLLVSLHSVGNLFASFTAGILPVWLGRKRSILLFSSCYTLAFLLILLSGHPAMLVPAFFMTGLCRGAVSNFNNTEINMLAPGQGWALNALHASFAVGAFAAPMLVLLCAQILNNWKLMCTLLVIFGILDFLIFAFMPLSVDRLDSASQRRDFGFFRRQKFWLTTGTLFFYLCAEQGVVGWMVTYFKDTGLMSPAYAQGMASILWVLILIGRLTAAWLCTRVHSNRLLTVMGAGMVLFFLIVLTGKSLPIITFGIAGFGFSMAGLYPTRVSITSDLMKEYPMAWSFILSTASLGSILMPSIIGAVAQSAGLQMGISTIILAVIATFSMTVLALFLEYKDHSEAN